MVLSGILLILVVLTVCVSLWPAVNQRRPATRPAAARIASPDPIFAGKLCRAWQEQLAFRKKVAADQDGLCMLQQFVHAAYQSVIEMGQPLGESSSGDFLGPAGFQGRIVDLEVIALADEVFGQGEKWAFAQIVSVGFEGQPIQTDFPGR